MRLRGFFCLAAGGLLSAFPVFSQTTFASITGTVTDSAGAIIANAVVEATHLSSNYKYEARSNEVGAYTLAQLREGTYTLRASAPGFREYVVQNIELVSRDQRRIDIQLQVGAVETRIEVSAGATLIETETARIGDTKGTRALNTLPLNTRSLYSFLALSPGVVAAGGGQATRRFAGSRVNQSDQSIDGITVSNGFDGTQISPLVSYIESFEEVRVDMANNTADIGSVGQVTIISKSGTNELHGSLFDYYVTPAFRARNPFAAERSSGVSHQPGGTIGGPIVLPKIYNGRNRSFFFYSFETSRGSQIQQLINPTVPLPSWRAGNFSNISTPIVDPFNNRTPFAGNIIPASRINPTSQRIQERFYPLPNMGDPNILSPQNFRQMLTRPFDPNTYYTTRIDHRFSDRSFIFGRWTFNRSHSREYEGNLPTIGRRWQTRDTRALNISYTHNLRPDLLLESRWGLAYNDNPRHGPILGREMVQDLGLTGLADNIPADLNGLIDLGFQGLGIEGLAQTPWRHPGFKNFAQQWQQHVNWYRGKHSLKSGFQLSRVNFQDQNQPAALFGQVRFSNRFTGHPYADFLLGIPTTAQRAFPAVLIDRTRWAYDFFVTDDYKITSKLSLSLGLRYELHPSYTESNGLQAVFDIGRGAIVVPAGALNRVSPLMPRDYVDVIEAREIGLGSRLIQTDTNNFAPRLGVAWRPFGNDTVIRAGYGVFYDVVPRAEAAGGSPFVINEPQFTNPVNSPTVIFPRVFPTSVGGPSTVGLPMAIRRDLRVPFSMQYNFTIEHQRWDTGFRLSYIGTNTRQGEWSYNINQPVPDTRPFVDKPRLFPRYPAINYLSNGAGHQYHSLTFEAERRFARGLAWQFSYVLARDIGDLDRGASPENAYDRRRERGVWLDIPTHRVTGNLIYELPFGRGKKFGGGAGPWLNAVIGGWETTAVFSYYSGQFLTPLWTGPDPTGTAFTSSRTPPTVTIRPDHLRNGNLPSDERSPQRWFDPTAFGAPAAGRFGTSARGVIIGPDSNTWHLGVAKHFHFTERARLRWELTATNALNHPNYSLPSMNIVQQADVGVIRDVGETSSLDQAGERVLRMGLRLEW